MRLGLKAGQWGWSLDELEAAWRVAEEAGLDLISCFDHVSGEPGNSTAWDAPTLLALMAARTERVRLAVQVLNASLRPPLLLAGQLAVVQEASRGRLEVGLGAGSFHLARFDHRVAGIPFPAHAERIRRLEACCGAFPALWRGERVTDGTLGLRDATLGPRATAPPPIVVGGTSDAVLEIAARWAEGWNASSVDPARFERLVERLVSAAERVGRTRPIDRQVQIWAREAPLERLGDLMRSFADAGADTFILVLDEERDPRRVPRIVDALVRGST